MNLGGIRFGGLPFVAMQTQQPIGAVGKVTRDQGSAVSFKANPFADNFNGKTFSPQVAGTEEPPSPKKLNLLA